MGPGAESRVLMDQLTSGRMEYPLMDDEYDVVALGDPAKVKRYGMPADRKKYEENLIKHFPKEEEAIKKFMDLLLKSKSAFTGFFALKMFPKWLARLLTQTGIYNLMFKAYLKYFKISLKEVVDDLTDNEELKAVFCYIFGDYGVVPSKSSFAFHSVLINHYMHGSYYIRGGTNEVTYQMIPTIERHGGAVLVKAPVTKILMDAKGKAVGKKYLL
ncbi:hypothetical protein KUTeg_009834 [Tegillarca granosa]|uniref:Uncharacterized protein n=1 Tax=Tegillarca granosa TaxID=220873 RepID=A0ABQ9F8B0_TEGGR|nr:hypothetical protein KUTeg_009834 [Tegillarca granosa]